jgi:hypothetical protein
MSSKIITLDDNFYTGEPTVQLVSTWGRNGRLLREKTSIHKVASTKSPALDFADSIMPSPGRTIVLIIGLGDHETYGPNRNGDGFPSEPIPGKIEADQVLTKHYQSYDNAHVFEHHVNSDPEKAIGKVIKSFWNPHMRRVEVIEDFDNKKAPHLLEKILAGNLVATSMGCRIKYDTCSICGNKAPQRKDYCDHLKYEMNRIYPDGKQACALNPSPVFFDSSFVIRPADRTGYMLKKVARENIYDVKTSSYEIGELAESLLSKAAEIGKAADIEKVIQGEPIASVSSLDESDAKLLDRYKNEVMPEPEDRDSDGLVRILIAYKPSEAIGTAEGEDIPLGMKELLNYFFCQMAQKEPLTDEITKSANAHVEPLLHIFSQYPRFYDQVTKEAGLDNLRYNEKLANSLSMYNPKTPTQDYLQRQILPAGMRPNERGLTDVLTYTDPNTGQQYRTDYGTVQKTHDSLVRKGMKDNAVGAVPYLGGSAVLGTAALGMGLSRRFGKLPTAAAGIGSLGLGALGAKRAVQPPNIAGPKIQTDQGEVISGWTEMVPTKRASHSAPEINYMIKRAYDGKYQPLSKEYKNQLYSIVKSAEIRDNLSDYLGPNLDLDKVAAIIGKSILQTCSN